MPEFNLARTFRNRGLLLQTGSQFPNSASQYRVCEGTNENKRKTDKNAKKYHEFFAF